jgi:hypothetical protein
MDIYKEVTMQNWVFHINPYTKEIHGAKREHYKELFNGGEHVVKAKSFEELCDKILSKEIVL